MRLTSLLMATLLLVGTGAALAKTGTVTGTGTVAGSVVDDCGQPVESARVSLWLNEQCIGYTLSNGSGNFLIENLSSGTYTLRAGKKQVGQAEIEGVIVSDGNTTNVGVIMLVGQGPHGAGS